MTNGVSKANSFYINGVTRCVTGTVTNSVTTPTGGLNAYVQVTYTVTCYVTTVTTA